MKPTLEKLTELWAACELWRNQYKPLCPESMYQVDSVNIACPELAIEICNIIGYYIEDSDLKI